MMKKEIKFPEFYYDSNLAFLKITSKEDLEFVFKQYKGHLTPSEILDKSKCHYDGALTNFGLYSEHKGKVTLREFLKDNGIEYEKETK